MYTSKFEAIKVRSTFAHTHTCTEARKKDVKNAKTESDHKIARK